MQNVKNLQTTAIVKTVGLVIDECNFDKKEALIESLVASGFKGNNIKIIVYNTDLKQDVMPSQINIDDSDLSWSGNFKNPELDVFVNTKFDLLINYYNSEKKILLFLSNKSEALFKIGFSSVDKRLNHLSINTDLNEYTVFINELFRYLKILNKFN